MNRDAMVAHLCLLGWEPRSVGAGDYFLYSETMDVKIGFTMACGKRYCPIDSRPYYRGHTIDWRSFVDADLVGAIARANELNGISNVIDDFV